MYHFELLFVYISWISSLAKWNVVKTSPDNGPKRFYYERDDGITVVCIVWKFKLLGIKWNLPDLIPFNIVLLRNVGGKSIWDWMNLLFTNLLLMSFISQTMKWKLSFTSSLNNPIDVMNHTIFRENKVKVNMNSSNFTNRTTKDTEEHSPSYWIILVAKLNSLSNFPHFLLNFL